MNSSGRISAELLLGRKPDNFLLGRKPTAIRSLIMDHTPSIVWLIIGLTVNMLPYTKEVQWVFKLFLNSFGVVHQTEFQ